MHKILRTLLASAFLFGVNLTPSVQASQDPANDSQFDFHRTAKHFMYGTLIRQSARNVSRGTEQPLLKFKVLDEPQSVFINFEIRPDKVDELLDFLKLPNGFGLAEIAILEEEEPRFYISLNIYAVDGLNGLLTGLRAEWSVYVQKDGGRTSFMVIDAKAENLTLDSVNWFSLGSYIRHELTDNGYESFVASGWGSSFASIISADGIADATLRFTNPSWIAANDRIYWLNGVADRTYYDGEFMDTPVLDIDPAALSFSDTTVWSQFVYAEPVSVLLFQKGFELVISPWFNIDPE